MRKRSRRNLLLCCFFLLWNSLTWAEETPPLKKGVLVLPLQAGEGISGDNITLGIAVQNVIENMLTLHNDLEECWMNWHLAKLFPQEEDYRAWIQGKGNTPAAVQELGFRYLLTGHVRQRGEQLVATVELLDRATGAKQRSELGVDLPTLRTFREGMLTLLEQAGIPAPAGQREKMLWTEELPFPAFALLGQGVTEYYATNAYHKDQPQWNPKPFDDGLAQAPRSYLLQNSRGWMFYVQKNYPEARRRFEQAVAINPAGTDAADGMILCARSSGEEELEVEGVRNKARMQGREEKNVVAALWYKRGDTAFGKGEAERAITCYQHALTLFREIHRQREEALVLNSLGRSYYWLSQYAKAIEYYEHALTIVHKIGGQQDEAAILDNIGVAYANLGQYRQAIEYYERSLNIRQATGDRDGEASVLGNLAQVYSELGQYAQAINYFEKALAIRVEVKNLESEGAILNNLGSLYSRLEEAEKGLRYLERARVVWQEAQFKWGECRVLMNLGDAYTSQAQNTKAVEYYEQSLRCLEEVGDRQAMGWLLTSLAAVNDSQGQEAKAISIYRQALAIAQEVKNPKLEASVLNELAIRSLVQGHFDEATQSSKRAAYLFHTLNNREGEAFSFMFLCILAQLHKNQDLRLRAKDSILRS